MFLDKSDELRDVDNNGSRFWVADPPGKYLPFGEETVGIVDENEGGIVAYVHANNAERTIEAFRGFTGEQ